MKIATTTGTFARFNVEAAIEAVSIVLKTHDAETKRAAGRPSRSLEVFKRTGVILAVTAWEAYIEDTLTQQFQERLQKAVAPDAIKSTFNSVSQAWLSSAPKPPDLAKWAGDGWKNVILEKFQHDIFALNTPNSDKLKNLFERYFNLDITKYWKWQKISSNTACQKLDALIKLRGELVHKGKEIFESKAKVRRSNLVEAQSLVQRLVECTDLALNIAPVEKEI